MAQNDGGYAAPAGPAGAVPAGAIPNLVLQADYAPAANPGVGNAALEARVAELESALKQINDKEEADVFGGRVVGHTIGLNWYLNPNTRLMFNLIH